MIIPSLAVNFDILQKGKIAFSGLISTHYYYTKMKTWKIYTFIILQSINSWNDIIVLEKLFKHVVDFDSFNSISFVISAISLPRFELNWVPEQYI